MKLIRRVLVLTLTCAAVIYPTVFAATSVAQRAAPPQIASASPSQIAASTSTATISINGSGFDSNARVELMYDVGAGAGQWRLPRHGYQVLSPAQIRLTVMPGTDPDQLRIRVVSGNGTSNQTTVRIVASAPKAVAAPKPSVSVTQPSMTTAGSTPPIAPSVQSKAVTPKATPALPTPKIDAITPPSLTASTQTQTITINGNGFDRDTRVEWMYGVGDGAGQWRSPRNAPKVLSSTQITVAMQSGNDPDRMQIRVVNKQGISNIGNLAIVKAASNAASPTAQTRSASPLATPVRPTLALTPPVLPSPSMGTMAATTPLTANIASQPALRIPQFNSCGPSGGGGDIKQKLLSVIKHPIDSAWAVGVAASVRALTQYHEVVTAVGRGYSFDPACVSHDACYGRCGPPGARDLCDQEFYRYLGAICGTVQDTKTRAICEDNRLVYTGFVIQNGKGRYDKSCPTSQSASQLKSVMAPPTLASALAANAADTSPQTSKPATQPAPKISAITPSSLPISTQMQTIIINGSGFDRETRVEWMYGVGDGAGQWRSPRNAPKILSSTQITVAMQSGNDPDRMQIRVVNKQGYSNVGNLTIVKSPSTGNSRYPISGPITQGFGVPWSRKSYKTHTGIDIAASRNTEIPSMGAGKVAHIHNLTGGDGYAVIIQENSGAIRGYLHLNPTVKQNDSIKAGQIIGRVVNDHLHYNLCKEVNLCWRGALATDKVDPDFPKDPLFRNGPFIRP